MSRYFNNLKSYANTKQNEESEERNANHNNDSKCENDKNNGLNARTQQSNTPGRGSLIGPVETKHIIINYSSTISHSNQLLSHLDESNCLVIDAEFSVLLWGLRHSGGHTK